MKSNLIYLSETTSTNLYLRELSLKENIGEKTVVYSDFQTSGRGQKGNSWESERDKNMLFSILLHPDFIEVQEQFIISQIVSLAIQNILSEYTDEITIKWPNDIYYKNLKICGILIENDITETRITRSIAGIGININQEKFYSNAPNPVSLKQITKTDYDRDLLLEKIINRISSLYELAKTDKQQIIKEYKENIYRRNGFFPYEDIIGSTFSASIEDIEPSGILVLKTNLGEIKRFAFKEVIFR